MESEPWSGSVSANAPRISIRDIGLRYFFFCSSEPSRLIDCMARPAWTPSAVAVEASRREISKPMRRFARMLISGSPSMSMPSRIRPRRAASSAPGMLYSAFSHASLMLGRANSQKSRAFFHHSRSAPSTSSKMR